jgi:hypothetical protein
MQYQDTTRQDKKDRAKKQAYSTPTLACYGAVAALTQSGSGLEKEGNAKAGGGACTATLTKRSCNASDPRAKQNIVRIGTHPLGIGVYLFDYMPEFQAEWGHGRQFGVMADEVETVMPQAVCVHANGYKMVDYAMLGVRHAVL